VVDPGRSLDWARKGAGLTQEELWLRYFELGGMSTAMEVEGIVCGALGATDYDHDILAHAINERFSELGGDHPVPYAGN
jgi:hypothetical protein